MRGLRGQISAVRGNTRCVALDLDPIALQPVESKRIRKVHLLEEGLDIVIAVGPLPDNFEAQVDLRVGLKSERIHTAKVAD